MSKLPATSARKAIRAFGKAGFVVDRINGSHAILKKTGHKLILSIPLRKNLPKPLLQAQIKNAGLTDEEFCSLL